MELKPIKRLLYAWFGNFYALFELIEFLGYMYALWACDWIMAFYKLSTGAITIIPAFFWCMGLTELNLSGFESIISRFELSEELTS